MALSASKLMRNNIASSGGSNDSVPNQTLVKATAENLELIHANKKQADVSSKSSPTTSRKSGHRCTKRSK